MGVMVDRDQEHLKLVEIGFYVMAGMIAFFSLFTLIYIFLGALIASGAFPETQDAQANPRWVGLLFVGLGTLFLLLGMSVAFLTYLAGRNVRKRRGRIYSIVIAGLCCTQVPLGTAFGVGCILVLVRPSVVALFEPPLLAPSVPSPSPPPLPVQNDWDPTL